MKSGNDTVKEIHALTGGADACFEVVGISPTINLALNSLRTGGSLVLVGNLSPRVEFPLQKAVTGELNVHGSCASAGEYPRALELIASGEIDVKPMISETAPLEDGGGWFKRLSKEDGSQFMKIILKP